MMLAVRHPRRVRSMVLFAPANPYCDMGRQLIAFYQTNLGMWLARQIPWLPRGLKATALSRMYGNPSRVAKDALAGLCRGSLHPRNHRPYSEYRSRMDCGYATSARVSGRSGGEADAAGSGVTAIARSVWPQQASCSESCALEPAGVVGSGAYPL